MEEKWDTEDKEEENSRFVEKLKELERKREDESRRNKEEWRKLREEESNKIQELKESLKKQEENFRFLEKKNSIQRKKNIVIRGLRKGNSVLETTQNFVRQALQVNGKIINAYEVGKTEHNKLIVAELETWEMKTEVMKNRYRLRGKEIYIDDDLTRRDREIQKKMRDYARIEKDQNKKVRVGYKKICIDDTWFSWNEIEGRPEKTFLAEARIFQ